MGTIGGDAGGTSQVIFFDDRHGIVVGTDEATDNGTAIWATVDGGARWTSVVPKGAGM